MGCSALGVCGARDEGAHQHGMVQRLVQRLACVVVCLAVALVGLRLKHEVHLFSCQAGWTFAQCSTQRSAAQGQQEAGGRRGRRRAAGGRRQATGVVGGHVLKHPRDEICGLWYSPCNLMTGILLKTVIL